MKKFIILFLFVAVSYSFPQQKYFIYFKDKGISKTQSLNKTSAQYNEALSLLSERSIERRKKVMGDNFITYGDLPVSKNYITELTAIGVKIERELSWFNSVSAFLDANLINKIKQLPFVEKVEPVKVIKFKPDGKEEADQLQKPSGSEMNLNYGNSYTQLQLCDIPIVHSRGINGKGILIGLLDSGFDWKRHESLMNATVVDEYDFVFNDTVTANQSQDRGDQDSHGTLVFSVVGGYKDSVLIGAAYGADFILAKTEYIPTETHVEEDNYAAALIWMEAHGVDVTSSSLGYNEFDSPEDSYTYENMDGKTTIVTKALEEAFSKGIVTITSAGNEGNTAWRYIGAPADGFNVISVGAISSNKTIASFSSVGPTYDGRIKPEVVTLGVGVFRAVAGTVNDYSTAQGTSLSAPIACGVAALLLSAYPKLTNIQVRNILLETSDNSENPNNEKGYGLMSAMKAISYPNLVRNNDTYRLNKAFLDKNNIVPSSVVLHYFLEGGAGYTDVNTEFNGDYKYSYDLPAAPNDNSVSFYYTYSDSSGSAFRDPISGSYKFEYGNLNIILGVDNSVSPEDFVLRQNYPNPFNNQTIINFTAGENEKAELFILDAIGQQTKTLFNGLTKKGVNSVAWDGRTENGYPAASGVYYYILKLNGKEYGKKMILLK